MPTRVPILYGPMAVLERRRVSQCCCIGFFFTLILYIMVTYYAVCEFIYNNPMQIRT